VHDEHWLAWNESLLIDNREHLKYLLREKGITEDTVESLGLGWSSGRDRYTIPVFDESEACVNVRLYFPHAQSGDDKVKNYWDRSGHSFGRNRLYVPGQHYGQGLYPSRRTLLCAGEFDAILAWQHGWQAATLTGGEASHFPTIDLHRIRGQQVYLAYDNDDAGREGTERLAQELASIASVWVVDLSTLDLPEKGDLGDVFLREDLGPEAVLHAVHDAEPWEKERPGATWLSVDLQDVVDGTHELLEPTVCRRAGSGLALFYPGKTHALIAESEAGKTWLALFAAKQEIDLGNHVFFYDFEDGPSGIVGRLLDMNVDPNDVIERFHYARPDEPLTPELRRELLAEQQAVAPTLVIVDGVTEVMTQHDWGQNDNAAIAEFYRTILRPMADLGAAVVALDHLPKYDEKRRGAIGGVHKLNGIDGAAYRLNVIKEIVPGQRGITSVTVDKDRPGQVKRQQDDRKRIADLIVDSEDNVLTVDLEMPGDVSTRTRSDGHTEKPLTGNRALVLNALSTSEERTTTQIVRETRVAATTVKRILKDFEEEGRASKREEETGGKKVHYWLRETDE
jgi:hypothetical protein